MPTVAAGSTARRVAGPALVGAVKCARLGVAEEVADLGDGHAGVEECGRTLAAQAVDDVVQRGLLRAQAALQSAATAMP